MHRDTAKKRRFEFCPQAWTVTSSYGIISGSTAELIDRFPATFIVLDALDIVQFLVESGADVNASGGRPAHNALQAASGGGHDENVQYLNEHGAVDDKSVN
jgi:hypothetical protein